MFGGIYKYLKLLLVACMLLCAFGTVLSQENRNLNASIIPDSTSAGDSIKTNSLVKNTFGNFDNIGESKTNAKDKIKHSSILDLLDIKDRSKLSYSWHLNTTTYNLENDVVTFDTILFQPHLFAPYQKDLIPFNGLGNLGAPVQSVSFFKREQYFPFLFSRYYSFYQMSTLSRVHFNVKSPHTLLKYSTGGKTTEAEQVLQVFHTQNVNKHINFGIQFDYFTTKGMYSDQLTRNNDFSGFASYYKDKIFGQLTVNTSKIRNQENGGISDEYYLVDTTLESRLVPMMLEKSSVEFKRRCFSLMAGYNIIEKTSRYKNIRNEDSVVVKPIITSKVLFEFERYSRRYDDKETDSSFYSNFYINSKKTHDSVMLMTYSTTALVEINQIAKYPGVPGLRAWLTNTSGRYNTFDISDYIFSNNKKTISTNHLGIGVYSKSDYLNYSGAIRLYLNGYRAGDKEVYGELSLLPWKSKDLPYLKGEIRITSYEPDIFIKDYFSNHYKWHTDFNKQQVYKIGAELGTEKWRTWIGYNMAQLTNYIYFNEKGMPKQSTDGVTITSAYLKNYLRFGWFWWVNNVIWQKSSNEAVLSLPKLSLYSSFYLQHYIIKDVLTVQLGISAFYNSAYYADGYNPAIGQFYNQRNRLIGNYPIADVFINMKWKSAILFLKYEHINQGYPNNDFFVSYKYPANQQAFKFGLSWMFYN